MSAVEVLKDGKFIKWENQAAVNFGFNKHNCWTKFSLRNTTSETVSYLLVISNPDLNYLDFFEIEGSQIRKKITTGELRKKDSRPFHHRFFIFHIELNPHCAYTYLICSNNEGDTNLVPVTIQNETTFYKKDLRDHFLYAIIYGILLFIIGFNFYLYRIKKDIVYIYYLLFVLFSTIYSLSNDGYLYYLNFQWLSNMGRVLIPALAIVFFITFSQKFLGSSVKWPGINKVLNFLKILMLILGVLPIFHFTFFISPFVIGVTLIFSSSFLIFIIYAFKSYNKEYIPSQYFLLSFIIMVLFAVVFPLKETGILPHNFFTVNSFRFGFLFECIILTIAVLERFRIQMEQANQTIKESYSRIELQNEELEVINTELEKLSIVASETNNSVSIYSADGRLEWCNSHFENFYKTSLEKLIKSGKDRIETIIPNPLIKVFVSECVTTKKPVSFETHAITDSEKDVWVQTTLSPYIIKGEIYKLITVETDISTLKQYEKSLEIAKEKAVESDRLKTVFLGNLSHEIRTPLNGIMGFSELLYNKNLSEEKMDKYLKLITGNGEQLLRIIEDIVDISLIESNQLKINPVPVDLKQFLESISEFFNAYKKHVNKSEVDFIVDNQLSEDERVVAADPIRLKQILNNLINNGYKFTKQGYVKLECKKAGEFLRFTVEDTGIGLDPKYREVVFERFRQVDERLNREYGGTGLGLSISKGIVDKMNGTIWIEPDANTGMKISFQVPWMKAAPLPNKDSKVLQD